MLYFAFVQRPVHAPETPGQIDSTTSTPSIAPIGGHWAPAPGAATGLDPDAQEKLSSVGYVAGYEPAPAASGAIQHDPARVQAGLNFVVSSEAPAALLMDMDGRTLHRWAKRYNEVFPTPAIPSDRTLTFGECMRAQPDLDPALIARLPAHFRDGPTYGQDYWRWAYVYPNGDLLTFYSYLGFVKLDRNSNVIWSRPLAAHHDVTADAAGLIYALALVPREVQQGLGEEGFILDDQIVVMDAAGATVRQVSVLDSFLNSPFAAMVRRAPQQLDLFHTNAIELLDGRIADRIPAFRTGNFLVSCRNLHTLAVIDPEQQTVVWAAAGPWAMQHDPVVLDSGRILLFDNQGYEGRSRVIEFDPVTFEIAWQYAGTPPDSFYSFGLGVASRLPNGNTLIAESTRGRAFEVTPGKDIVWEYINPARAGEHRELIAAVFEALRLPLDFGKDWLAPATP